MKSRDRAGNGPLHIIGEKKSYWTPNQYNITDERTLDDVKESVDLLVANGADINSRVDSRTPLISLLTNNWPSPISAFTIKQIIMKGADLAMADSYGKVSLHYAARWGNDLSVMALLDAGADMESKDYDLSTPLHEASKQGSICLSALKALLRHGANYEACDRKGRRPLHYAVKNSSIDALTLLIRRGAALNPIENSGATPLHLAAMHGQREAIDVLLRNGANPEALDLHGMTPVHYAARYATIHSASTANRLHMGSRVNYFGSWYPLFKSSKIWCKTNASRHHVLRNCHQSRVLRVDQGWGDY